MTSSTIFPIINFDGYNINYINHHLSIRKIVSIIKFEEAHVGFYRKNNIYRSSIDNSLIHILNIVPYSNMEDIPGYSLFTKQFKRTLLRYNKYDYITLRKTTGAIYFINDHPKQIYDLNPYNNTERFTNCGLIYNDIVYEILNMTTRLSTSLVKKQDILIKYNCVLFARDLDEDKVLHLSANSPQEYILRVCLDENYYNKIKNRYLSSIDATYRFFRGMNI